MTEKQSYTERRESWLKFSGNQEISINRLRLRPDWPVAITAELEAGGVRILPIGLEHCTLIATLPFHHRDPFDRMLVAQALHGGMTLMTADSSLGAYGVKVLW